MVVHATEMHNCLRDNKIDCTIDYDRFLLKIELIDFVFLSTARIGRNVTTLQDEENATVNSASISSAL
jgi:hypothetical protein